MHNKTFSSVLVAAVTTLAINADAAKPTDDQGLPFGNGFPSGPHHNLILNAKKTDFNCPPAEFDETGTQVFGNTIFFPREQNGDPINVLMESGSKGPKSAPATATLEVTDWCTESFPDDGTGKGDPAVLRLPANAGGYAVYGRLGGKPLDGGEPSVSIQPDLFAVTDEAGNDLILLGLVDKNGTSTFSSDGATLYRTATDGSTGKGARKATNLTGLFEWTGEICYLQTDLDAYCYDALGNYTCSSMDLCCRDDTGPGGVPDGIYEECGLLTDVGVLSDDGTTLLCPADLSIATSAACQSYDNQWVFNIADFVDYMWSLDTTGAYHVQIRLYPLP
ncbi:MAG: hypothetical protein ABFS45_17785 [Pseudomonadota bacterium]